MLVGLQNGLETINHEILFKQREVMKISKQSIKWIRSYVCDQIFFWHKVKTNGSILGNVLFLIFGNYMPKLVK